MTSEIIYRGELSTQAVHLRSGTIITTDAPVDNRGKGTSFSPTDLVATAMGSCVMTIMGIKARDHGIDMTGAKMSITKKMLSEPRRIGAIDIVLEMPNKNYSDIEQKLLEKTLDTCPVGESLHPDLKVHITLNW